MWESIARFANAVADFFWHLWDPRYNEIEDKVKEATRNSTKEDDRNIVKRATANLDTHSALDDEIIEELEEIGEWPWLLRMIGTGYAYVTILGGKLKAWTAAITNLRAQLVNADIRPQLVGVDTAVSYLLKQRPDAAAALDILNRWGLPAEQQAMLLDASEQLPSLVELMTMVNREIITPELAVEFLTRQGVTPENAVDLLELRYFQPSPQDIVSLAGREAYEEDAIERFKLDQDMPAKMFEEARKAGLRDDTMRQFWVAHWQNPSLIQVFQMIHRGVTKVDGRPFDLDDLDVYYRLADVNPFFGDLLRQIAFITPGRVDIRRMLSRNIIDRDKAKQMYQWLGYDDDNAEILTQFAEEEQRTFGKELSRTQLEKLYKQGVIDAIELADDFVDIGYDAEEAQFLIHLLDVEIEEEQWSSFIDRAEYEFKGGVTDRIQAEHFLTNVGVTTERIGQLLQRWINERITERTLPTKTDLLKWFDNDIISEAAFRREMKLHHYDDVDINRYLGVPDIEQGRPI